MMMVMAAIHKTYPNYHQPLRFYVFQKVPLQAQPSDVLFNLI